MVERKAVENAITGTLLLLIVVLLLGQVLGQPLLLSFVETGSMAPTLQSGDGFVAVPPSLAGEVEPGDVVVFDAERMNNGGFVTHRVVKETEAGFVTKGDANPFTDQESDANEPPVRREQIVAVAWQLGGSVVVIPKVGLLVTWSRDAVSTLQTQLAIVFGSRSLLGTQGLAYLLFAVGILAYIGSLFLERRRGTRRVRERNRNARVVNRTTVVLALTMALILVLTASMTLAGGTHQFSFVSSQSDAPGAGVIPTGSSENVTYTVPSNGVLPVVVFLEPTSDDIEVSPNELYVSGGGTVNATVRLHAPPETGFYRRYLVEHRYIAILPRTTIRALYGIHPWAPILAIDVLLGGGFLAFAIGFVGLGRTRIRSRGRDVSIQHRIKKWLR